MTDDSLTDDPYYKYMNNDFYISDEKIEVISPYFVSTF